MYLNSPREMDTTVIVEVLLTLSLFAPAFWAEAKTPRPFLPTRDPLNQRSLLIGKSSNYQKIL